MEKSKAPVLTGKEGEEFDVHVAAAWTKNHRERHPEDPHSHFFGKEILEKILNQDECVGLRFYYGHTNPASEAKSEKHLIIVGAKSDGSDMLSKAHQKPLSRAELRDVAPADDVVGQQAMPCPGSPGCPKSLMNTHEL